MRTGRPLLVVACALLAALLGLTGSVMLHGPGPLLASPLGGWYAGLRGATAEGAITLGKSVPTWQLRTLDAEIVVLPVPGRATLINYWASWCLPCREELPLLEQLAARKRARLAVIAVALDQPADTRRFLQRFPLSLPVPVEAPGARDSSWRLGNTRGVLPYSVLVGADGRLRASKLGAFRSAQELEAWLAAGLATP